MSEVSYAGQIIFCADVERSVRFYRDALGLEERDNGGDTEVVVPVADGGSFGLLLHPGTPEKTTSLGTFRVADVDTMIEKLRAAGYRISAEPTDEPWGVRLAGVLDPDGHGLSLESPL